MMVLLQLRQVWQLSATRFLWQQLKKIWPQSTGAAAARFVRVWFEVWAKRFRSVLLKGFSLLQKAWQPSVAAVLIPLATSEAKQEERKTLRRMPLGISRPRGRRKRLL